MKSVMEHGDFIAEAVEKGLIYRPASFRIPARYFYYDLNSGEIKGKTDPLRVLQLVELASKRTDGDHNTLLQLIAKRSDVDDADAKYVYWHRSYHIDHKKPGEWISLREWLEENGVPYVHAGSGRGN